MLENMFLGLVNRKSIDKWEEIIDAKLLLIKKTPKTKGIADETNINKSNYK